MKVLHPIVFMLVGGVLGMSPAQAVERNPLDLSTLFALAVEHNPSLSKAAADQSAALSALHNTKGLQKPEVRFKSEFSYAWMAKAEFPRTANQLVATYPLYQPQLDDLNQKSQFAYQGKRLDHVAETQKVFLNISQLYFMLWQQQENYRFLEKEQRSIESIIKQVKQRFQVGYQDLNDIAEIQSRLDFNRAEMLKAKQDIRQTQANLMAAIGGVRQSEERLDALTFPLKRPLGVARIEQMVQQAKEDKNDQAWSFLVESNPKVLALQQQWLASQKQVSYEKNKDTFQLEAFGAYVYNESDNHFYDDMQGARGGIQLNVPLYLGGRTDASVSMQRNQAQKVQAAKRELSLSLQAKAENAWLALQAGTSRLNALKAALNSSKQAVEANEQALKTGRRNILDLLDAQRQLHKIERDIPVLKASIWQNVYAFYWAIGNLNQETPNQLK